MTTPKLLSEEGLREEMMPLIESKIIESGFLEEHDKNVGGNLYTPENNRKLTASAIADILSCGELTTLFSQQKQLYAIELLDRLESKAEMVVGNMFDPSGEYVDVTYIQAERTRNNQGKEERHE